MRSLSPAAHWKGGVLAGHQLTTWTSSFQLYAGGNSPCSNIHLILFNTLMMVSGSDYY